jgi:hypothetical protein
MFTQNKLVQTFYFIIFNLITHMHARKKPLNITLKDPPKAQAIKNHIKSHILLPPIKKSYIGTIYV